MQNRAPPGFALRFVWRTVLVSLGVQCLCVWVERWAHTSISIWWHSEITAGSKLKIQESRNPKSKILKLTQLYVRSIAGSYRVLESLRSAVTTLETALTTLETYRNNFRKVKNKINFFEFCHFGSSKIAIFTLAASQLRGPSDHPRAVSEK